ncbi:hypothetical protein GCM10020254_13870 [Streptomyces goshikiensis]
MWTLVSRGSNRMRRCAVSLKDTSLMPLALLALAIGAFGIGTTEFVIMGLLPEVAADYGVTIPTAGFLVTGYALGVVLGAP